MPRVRRLTPMLFAKDIRASIDFYTNTLGFELAGTQGDPPTFCQLTSGDAQIMFTAATNASAPTLTGQIYFYPWDLDEAWNDVKDSAEVVMELRTQPWGMREFRIKDPNGYVLTFALSADPHHHEH